MSQGFIRFGTPVNGRQTYFITDERTQKRYIYSIPVQQADRFEKFDKEFTKRANNLTNNMDTQEITRNMEKNHVYTKAQIVSAISGFIGGVIPLALSMKFIKGTKKYIIGAISAMICGGLSVIAGYIGAIGVMTQKEIFKTEQGKDFMKLLNTKTSFDLRLERVDDLRKQKQN